LSRGSPAPVKMRPLSASPKDAHGVAQEAHLVAGGDAAAAGEDLQRHQVLVQAVDLGERHAEAGLTSASSP
jgi:hypothetical protein